MPKKVKNEKIALQTICLPNGHSSQTAAWVHVVYWINASIQVAVEAD